MCQLKCLRNREMSVRNYDEFPFSQLVPGIEDTTMLRRARTRAPGIPDTSARDIIKAVSAKIDINTNDPWLGVPLTTQAELLPHTSYFKFTGRGQRMEPVLTTEGCFILLMKLTGANAVLFRARTARLLFRFFSDDDTIMDKTYLDAAQKEKDAHAIPPAYGTRSRRASTRQRHAPY